MCESSVKCVKSRSDRKIHLKIFLFSCRIVLLVQRQYQVSLPQECHQVLPTFRLQFSSVDSISSKFHCQLFDQVLIRFVDKGRKLVRKARIEKFLKFESNKLVFEQKLVVLIFGPKLARFSCHQRSPVPRSSLCTVSEYSQ